MKLVSQNSKSNTIHIKNLHYTFV
uniref:Uncharacterized protein n=1 Tax=Cryptosporidium parvum TaxID=5807 RepID=F0X5F5_CRYPV